MDSSLHHRPSSFGEDSTIDFKRLETGWEDKGCHPVKGRMSVCLCVCLKEIGDIKKEGKEKEREGERDIQRETERDRERRHMQTDR